MINKHFFVDSFDAGARLDQYLTDSLDGFSRSYLQRLIKDGAVCIHDEIKKANYRVSEGDEIIISLPEPQPLSVIPQNIPLEILYEDDDLIFINKPKGIVVHPGAGHTEGTIVNALLYHCGDSLSGINGVLRPGIVHRIDKDTSGVIVICKNDASHKNVAGQLSVHSVVRKYYAVVNGVIEDDGMVDAPIERSKTNRLKMTVASSGGKRAVTHYRVLERFNKYTFIECQLETGRTHQIRVHMAHIGHPLMGDEVYGNIPCKFKTNGQVLHAGVLGLVHPATGQYIEFSAALPEYFSNILNALRG